MKAKFCANRNKNWTILEVLSNSSWQRIANLLVMPYNNGVRNRASKIPEFFRQTVRKIARFAVILSPFCCRCKCWSNFTNFMIKWNFHKNFSPKSGDGIYASLVASHALKSVANKALHPRQSSWSGDVQMLIFEKFQLPSFTPFLPFQLQVQYTTGTVKCECTVSAKGSDRTFHVRHIDF